MDPTGTILFSTIGAPSYGFDVFSLPLHSAAAERRLTDSVSINFNAQFDDDSDSVVFISERDGHPRIYRTPCHGSTPEPESLPCVEGSLFHDRPVLKKSRLYFISAHEKPDRQFKSWSALYSVSLSAPAVSRLTPSASADYSPAVSLSADFVAVASYGSRPWGGEFQDLLTDITVFHASDPTNRTTVCERGGWPSWCGDSALYFHRRAEDNWWSIYRADFAGIDGHYPVSPVRITPPGVHCFTPAAFHDGKSVAVATRRKGSKFRHIELFHLESKTFRPLTLNLNPEFHHYNPFVSADCEFVGYHRFRGRSAPVKTIIPNIDPVTSPIDGLRMLRVNGFFPCFSPDKNLIAFNHDLTPANAGVKIMKSDGSRRWTLLEGRTAFYNSWSGDAVFTSVGPIFESVKTPVQIARISFDASGLDGNGPTCEVKVLTSEESGNNAFPACSPDGKWVVFRSGRSGSKNLYVMDAVNGELELDGGSIRQLTDGAWIDTMPAWSPDGELIAFSSNRHNPGDESAFSIYLVGADGSGLRRVHVAEDVDRERINHVCFSKDGEWLLFTANLGGVLAEPVGLPNQFQPYGDLYVARLDGTHLRRLTWNAYENGTPAWDSPGVDLEFKFGSEESGDELLGEFQEPLWLV